MPKFVERRVEVEAVQFTNDIALKCLRDRERGPFGMTCGSGCWNKETGVVSHASLTGYTRDGLAKAGIGDWVVRYPDGRIKVFGADVFELFYGPADAA